MSLFFDSSTEKDKTIAQLEAKISQNEEQIDMLKEQSKLDQIKYSKKIQNFQSMLDQQELEIKDLILSCNDPNEMHASNQESCEIQADQSDLEIKRKESPKSLE